MFSDRTRSKRKRPRPAALVAISFVIVAIVIICALFGRWIAPYGANSEDLFSPLQLPSGAHWLGTDDLGRDVLSRLIIGATSAFFGPLLIAAGAMVIGTFLGLLAGWAGGLAETLIMRWVDLMYAVPQLLIAIVLVGILSGSYWEAVLVLIILTAPGDTRIIRGATLQQRDLPYVESLTVLGVSSPRILFGHVWPALMPLTIAQSFLNFATSLVTLASLSFLGLGVAPGAADWGRMLSDGRELFIANPWTACAPGLAIALTAASMNIVGDWIYERLTGRDLA